MPGSWVRVPPLLLTRTASSRSVKQRRRAGAYAFARRFCLTSLLDGFSRRRLLLAQSTRRHIRIEDVRRNQPRAIRLFAPNLEKFPVVLAHLVAVRPDDLEREGSPHVGEVAAPIDFDRRERKVRDWRKRRHPGANRGTSLRDTRVGRHDRGVLGVEQSAGRV